jgi:hypothetical protein
VATRPLKITSLSAKIPEPLLAIASKAAFEQLSSACSGPHGRWQFRYAAARAWGYFPLIAFAPTPVYVLDLKSESDGACILCRKK